jgi:hypothetical protein
MKKVFLRYATKDDAMFLFELVNDRECRKNSLNSKEITYEEHIQWLNAVLCSETRCQYILMEEEKSIGQGRLERIQDGCRISYSVIPQRRGCGYGKILLELLNNAILEDFQSCVYSYGEVLQKNIASQKIFEELGYKAEKLDTIFCYRKCVRQRVTGK